MIQVATCEGCGSRWVIELSSKDASVVAKLKECPLCGPLKEVS
jgi:hypothetical protein